MAEKLPNFFVVGAAKSGTTSLYEYLKLHPEVYMAPIKETHHFSTDIDNTKFRPNYARSLNKDLSKFLESDIPEVGDDLLLDQGDVAFARLSAEPVGICNP